jgi:L-iditol 2-dehydrogenase
MGSDFVVDISKEDIVQAAQQATGGAGVDVAIECAGVPDSLRTCLQAVRRGGTIVQVGIFPGPFEVDFNQVEMKELQIAGVYGYVWGSWEKSVALLAEGKVQVEPLISHDLPLSEWEEGFRAAEGAEGIKVLLRPE